MDQLYMTPGADYCASSMSFTSVPDLVTCAYDDASTDPSPSPPLQDDRRQRRSNNTQDKEAVSNMRIRRRAQNRASQRAFRERKEKHVQHLEHELEELEKKHRDLAKSYTDLDSTHGKLKWEAKQLKAELESLKSSRESSIASMKQEDYFDPFASDTFFGTGTAMGF